MSPDVAWWHSWWITACVFLWRFVLLRISHSIEALDSNLIGTVDQDHTKPLFQFGTELEMSAVVISCLHYHFIGALLIAQIQSMQLAPGFMY